MQKIPTIFKRNYSRTYQVTKEINPDCAWVFAGSDIPYRKYQGMAALIQDDIYYKRVILKKNQTIPRSFIPATYDPRAQKQFGWMPVDYENPQDQYYVEAYNLTYLDGTYELIGPKILNNHEHVKTQQLINHKETPIRTPITRTYHGLRRFLSIFDYEGIVFHNDDGRMAKIKKKDFGFVR